MHDYCCQAHAAKAVKRGIQPATNRRRQGQAAPNDRCSLPGCSAPRFCEGAVVYDFCGRTHARQAAAQGLVGAPNASAVERVWKGRDGEPSYTVSMMTNAHAKYASIKQQFSESWQHPGPRPTVMRILQVRNPAPIFASYENYRGRLAGLFQSGNGSNEVRRFHGTSMQCNFGINVAQPPCTHPDCAVCTIMATSFSLSHAGASGGQRMALRYGDGLYFSKVSSKSNSYAESSTRYLRDGMYRVMFLCKVSLGRTHRTSEAGFSNDVAHGLLTHHNSVTGLATDSGGVLNYEENVVYSPHAAIPSYLVVYRLPY